MTASSARRDRAIVLGCRHGGLAIVRSLTRHGVDVLVLTDDPDDPGLASRHVRVWHRCPDPNDEAQFVEALLSHGRQWSGALIFSTSDAFASVVSRHADRLRECYEVDAAPWHQMQTFLEKDQTYGLAAEIGVPHPKFVPAASNTELEAQLSDLQLPVMIKPVHSHRFVATFGSKLLICETEEELRENFQRVLDSGHEVMLSEIIPGSDYLSLETAQVYIDRAGEVAAVFCLIKLRQTPPMYGVIKVGRSIERTDELVEPALRLLRHVDFRGYASVEFKRDPRDGRLKLIEVNVRPLRMAQFAISCGVDFPYITLQDKLHGNTVRVDDYDVGTTYIDVVSDLADVLRYPDERHLHRFIEPYRSRAKTSPYLSLRDPKPFLREAARRAKNYAQKSHDHG